LRTSSQTHIVAVAVERVAKPGLVTRRCMGKTRSVEGTLSVVRTSTVTVVVAKIGTPRRVLTLDIVAVAAFAVLKLLVSASDVGPVLVVGAAGLGLRDVDGLLAAGLLHVYVVVADLVSLVVDNWS
jgi:hypothetical protein